MTRTCSDCPVPISKKSKGRCRSCAMSAVNRSPEKREANAMRKGFTAVSFMGCPPEYHALNRKMRRAGLSPEERYSFIHKDMAAQAAMVP